ncbi:MAG: lipoprotein, partial [Gammaproteobacteria bacterium]|nr:lipoprotein [Gammaproteobacteria bacterium]
MPARIVTAIALVFILLFVIGCGQKGDLYLPDDAAAR